MPDKLDHLGNIIWYSYTVPIQLLKLVRDWKFKKSCLLTNVYTWHNYWI